MALRSLGASERQLLGEIVTEMLMGGQGHGGAMIVASRFADSPGEIAAAGLCLVKGITVRSTHPLIRHHEAQDPTSVQVGAPAKFA